MKKITNFILFTGLVLTAILLITSCKGSCNCSKELECSTLTTKDNASGVTLEKKTYCSSIDFRSDQAFQDSINTFYTRHSSDNATTSRTDSILSSEHANKVSIKKTGPFEKKGFTCDCFK